MPNLLFTYLSLSCFYCLFYSNLSGRVNTQYRLFVCVYGSMRHSKIDTQSGEIMNTFTAGGIPIYFYLEL
jgi:hypothetical protein